MVLVPPKVRIRGVGGGVVMSEGTCAGAAQSVVLTCVLVSVGDGVAHAGWMPAGAAREVGPV